MARLGFMKKSLASFVLASLAVASPAQAHDDFEVTAGAGYRLPFGAEMDSENADGTSMGRGRLSFEGAPVFTGIFGYRTRRDAFIYVSYTRAVHGMKFELDDQTQGFFFNGSRVVEYYQFGGNVETTRGILVPYMGVSVGLGRIASLDGGDSRLFFAPVLDPGVKIELHEHVHLRLMGRIPLIMTGKDVVCTDFGCARTDDMKPIAQLELLGGLVASF